MIEIFRTNVTNPKDADAILTKIHSAFPGYDANFDLADCDHILRIRSHETLVCPPTIIGLISHLGFIADVLPDVVPTIQYSGTIKKGIQV